MPIPVTPLCRSPDRAVVMVAIVNAESHPPIHLACRYGYENVLDRVDVIEFEVACIQHFRMYRRGKISESDGLR